MQQLCWSKLPLSSLSSIHTLLTWNTYSSRQIRASCRVQTWIYVHSKCCVKYKGYKYVIHLQYVWSHMCHKMCTHRESSFVTRYLVCFSRYSSRTHDKGFLYVNFIEFMQTPTYKSSWSHHNLLCKCKIFQRNTLKPAFSFPHTPPINPPNQQNMFIFHCGEFTLGGSSVLTLSLFGRACCYSEAICTGRMGVGGGGREVGGGQMRGWLDPGSPYWLEW